MNKRTLKKIWICSDVLMDIFPFFDRPQLGLKLALLSPRFDALVDTHFDGKSELAISRWIKISKDSGPKPKLSVLIDGQFVRFPLPDHPLPNKIRFNTLLIEYIDHSVIEFLRANKQIWYRWGINLKLWLYKTEDEQRIWDAFTRQIWPIFAKSIRHLCFSDAEHFDELCRRISPTTILADFDQLISINCDQLLLDVIADDEPNATSPGHVLSEWLHTPRKDGKLKELFCQEFDGEGNMAWLNSFKETFIRANDASASYQICFGDHKPPTPIEPFELVNDGTNEKLTLSKEKQFYWLLKRCPIIVGETTAATFQWENAENYVQFNLWATNNCIGSLSPPAAEGPSGWAQQQ